MRPVSTTVQLAGGADENVKPGREGTITSKETFFPEEVVADWSSGLITGMNSWKEPVNADKSARTGYPVSKNRGTDLAIHEARPVGLHPCPRISRE